MRGHFRESALLDAILRIHYPADRPGGAVVVRYRGETILRAGYGTADQSGAPILPRTLFRIGSITKPFTAAAILLLEREGKLDLGDPARAFIPELGSTWGGVTLLDLLAHASGIPDYTRNPMALARMSQDVTAEEVISLIAASTPEFPPGGDCRYSNSGYYLLGVIVERASGSTWIEYLDKRLLQPLGMDSTGYPGSRNRSDLPSEGEGFELRGGRYVPAPGNSVTWAFSAGGLISCVDDLGGWDAALQPEGLLPSDLVERMGTPHRLSDGRPTPFGLGWWVGDLDGLRLMEHGGGIAGFAGHLMRLPEREILVALLSNNPHGSPPPRELCHQAARVILGAAS